jgi:hypothetical protein
MRILKEGAKGLIATHNIYSFLLKLLLVEGTPGKWDIIGG